MPTPKQSLLAAGILCIIQMYIFLFNPLPSSLVKFDRNEIPEKNQYSNQGDASQMPSLPALTIESTPEANTSSTKPNTPQLLFYKSIIPWDIFTNITDLSGFESKFDAASASDLRQQNRARLDGIRRLSESKTDSLICNATYSPFPAHQRRKVRLFHIPKTGSTFFNTFARYACHDNRNTIPYIGDRKPGCVGDHSRKNAKYGKFCEYEGLELGPHIVKHCDYKYFYFPKITNNTKQLAESLKKSMLHSPIGQSAGDTESAIGLFRMPSQRIISAFGWAHHTQSMQPTIRKYMNTVVLQEGDGNSPPNFARFPGVRGCQTKMLLGNSCGSFLWTHLRTREDIKKADLLPLGPSCFRQSHHRKGELLVCMVPDFNLAKEAAVRVQSMAFAGIQEEWNLSVCLLHRLLGGDVSDVELRKTHVQKQPNKTKDTILRSNLDGFVDIADELVYEAVLTLFESKLNCVISKLEQGNSSTELCAYDGPAEHILLDQFNMQA